jgi:hypothetical protein
MEKYGFIYIWYDKKHKKFYIGRHWGTESDGYICSSTNMRNNYKNRPYEFKRRILKRIYTNIEDLVTEEQRWLDMIKIEECGVKYYNKTLKSTTPSSRGHVHSEETKQKMRNSALNRKLSEHTKEKLRQANLGKKYSEEINSKKGINSRVYTEDFKDKMSLYARNRSQETRNKISTNSKRLHAEGKIGMKGKKHSPETIEKMKNAISLRKSSRNS